MTPVRLLRLRPGTSVFYPGDRLRCVRWSRGNLFREGRIYEVTRVERGEAFAYGDNGCEYCINVFGPGVGVIKFEVVRRANP